MPHPPIHVLLTEDDDAYAAMLAAELTGAGEGITLARARTAAEACAALAVDRFDAVLLDLHLPDSSGLDTVEAVRAAAGLVPILVVTSHDDDEAALAAVQRGAQDYLLKARLDAFGLVRSIRYARERAHLRHALVEREARFRALVEHSMDAITLVDEHLVAVYNSGSIERVTGFSAEALTGRRIDDFVHPEDIPELNGRFAECVAHPGHAVPVHYRYRHRDGTWHWGEAVVVNRLEDGAVRAIVINHRDVTERRTAEEALKVTEAQLRQAHKMEAVGRLAGGVAHDFNNVLTAIFGYADLLLDQFPHDDPRRSDVEEIRRSAERAAGLTRQLLAFSRRQVLQPRVLSLNDVVAGLEKLLARLVGGDVIVEIRAARELWAVRADPGQIEQVLMNLAANARDAMPEGGTLTVETANVLLDAEALRDRPGLSTGEYACLSVSDTGTGIPDAVRRHIFEPFFTTKEQGRGTGLGLATVYGIVKQSGGGIYLESEEGVGTRFRVFLPRVPADATSLP